MSQRYYVEQPIAAANVRMAGVEAHHLLHVMRCRPGDAVILFDGSGREFQASVVGSGRDWVDVQVHSSSEINRELSCELVIAAPLPKGDRQRTLVEKLVELGVTSFVPLAAARAISQGSDNAISRLRRYAIEASKQCGRNWLMHIENAVDCETFFSTQAGSTKIIAHPGGIPISQVRWLDSIAVAVGPEGGFTRDELQMAQDHGWQNVDLGPRTLRTETAAIFLATAANIALPKSTS